MTTLKTAEDVMPDEIVAWPSEVGPMTGSWSVNTHYDERAVTYVRKYKLEAVKSGLDGPEIETPIEPGGFVGDIFFGHPDKTTMGTHRWNGADWEELPTELEAVLSLLADARKRLDEAEQEREQILTDSTINSEQRTKYETLCLYVLAGKASQHEAVSAIRDLCRDNERLAIKCGDLRKRLDEDASNSWAIGHEAGLREAAEICKTFAAQVADAALVGLPEQARQRESMEAAFTKAHDYILARIDAKPEASHEH